MRIVRAARAQVRNLELPDRQDLRKLQQLREEQGELSAADERRLKVLQRATEREVLQSADVVCTTCVGAGDPRLLNFRFRKVCAGPSARPLPSVTRYGINRDLKHVASHGYTIAKPVIRVRLLTWQAVSRLQCAFRPWPDSQVLWRRRCWWTSRPRPRSRRR